MSFSLLDYHIFTILDNLLYSTPTLPITCGTVILIRNGIFHRSTARSIGYCRLHRPMENIKRCILITAIFLATLCLIFISVTGVCLHNILIKFCFRSPIKSSILKYTIISLATEAPKASELSNYYLRNPENIIKKRFPNLTNRGEKRQVMTINE
ncbi:hypothetical protein NQ317_009222 [Molorchus minor]|uniref:Uncharacterized protein n=1 Tax=Molorchus minor TaxID=1323400 RepID=A0ABQ9J8P2_9CUCU|nr:hypothetical protein NQ317_009222 [Molorchus minor]